MPLLGKKPDPKEQVSVYNLLLWYWCRIDWHWVAISVATDNMVLYTSCTSKYSGLTWVKICNMLLECVPKAAQWYNRVFTIAFGKNLLRSEHPTMMVVIVCVSSLLFQVREWRSKLRKEQRVIDRQIRGELVTIQSMPVEVLWQRSKWN